MSDGDNSAGDDVVDKGDGQQKEVIKSCDFLDYDLPPCFSFTGNTSSSRGSVETPLVLLFAWMLAKEAHLEKYRTFWTSRGYDVLTVRTGPLDTLLPSFYAARNARRLIDFLRAPANEKIDEKANNRKQTRYPTVLIQGLSVGNYFAMEFLYQLKLAKMRGGKISRDEAEAVRTSIVGIIMDSITFLEDSAAGIAKSLTNSHALQLAIRAAIWVYFVATAPFTWSHFQAVVPTFTENPNRLSTLVLYCLDDPLSDCGRIKGAVEKWRGKGITVHEQCWTTSQHVLHYKLYPKEYTEAIEQFLAEVGDGDLPVKVEEQVKLGD